MSTATVRPATPMERVAGTAIREGLTAVQSVQHFVCDCTNGDHPATSRTTVKAGEGRLFLAVYGTRWHLATRQQVTVSGPVEGVTV